MGHAKQITVEPTEIVPGTFAEIDGEEHIFNGNDWQPMRGREIGHALQTVGGKFMWPLEPYADEIDFQSVARGLSTECRYGNQTPRPYPVAWHSVALSHVVPPEYAQAALIHDASEAFLKDIPRPIRRQEPFKTMYGDIERRLLQACFEYFEVDFDLMDNDDFLFYDLKMSWCEMYMLAQELPVYQAKITGLYGWDDEKLAHSRDETYIRWVNDCPRTNVYKYCEVAWLQRFDELF